MNEVRILCCDFEDAVINAKREILFILTPHMILTQQHLIVIQKMALAKMNKGDLQKFLKI